MDPGDSDYDWYLENVVVGGRPAQPGPALRRQLAWLDVATALRGTSAFVDLALSQGFVATTAQADEYGITEGVRRGHVRRGTWTSPHHGVICVVPAGDDARRPHGMSPEIRASAVALVTGTVIGSECAASAWGLPLLSAPVRPRVVAPPRRGCGRESALLRPAQLHAADLTTWFGAPITTVARTASDLARHDLRAGLAAADCALHEKLCTRDDLVGAIARARQWPGVRTARRLLDLSCADVESALESLARLAIADTDLPMPDPQVWITTPWGNYRADGLWAGRDVVLEVDGMDKYRHLEPAARATALTKEKRRQEHLERVGFRVVRVTWADVLHHEDETIRRIRWALRKGGERRPSYPPL